MAYTGIWQVCVHRVSIKRQTITHVVDGEGRIVRVEADGTRPRLRLAAAYAITEVRDLVHIDPQA